MKLSVIDEYELEQTIKMKRDDPEFANHKFSTFSDMT